MDILGVIFSFILFLILSSFFSASETAIVAVDKVKIRRRSEEGDKSAERILRVLESPERFLTTILIGNNLVNVAASAVATGAFVYFFGMKGVVIATVIVTIIILIFGEIIPKSWAVKNANEISPFFSLIISGLGKLISPIVSLLASVSAKLSGSVLLKPTFTTGDVEHMIKHSQIDQGRTGMLRGILRMEELTVRDIMLPGDKVVTLDTRQTFEENLKRVIETKHTRYPVIDSKTGSIVGIVLAKDILGCDSKNTSLDEFLRPARIISPEKPIHEQLSNFKKWKTHLACVVDEHGKFVGIVTLEDILEEIVGEIWDEYDVEERTYWMKDDEIVAKGNANIRDINRDFNLDIPEHEKTIAGMILGTLGRMPKPGDKVSVGKYSIIVESVKGAFISSVKIVKEGAEKYEEK